MRVLCRFSFVLLMVLCGSNPCWSEVDKARNPLKRRSRDENLELLKKMKRLYPVVYPPESVRARLELPSVDAPAPSVGTAGQVGTPRQTTVPAISTARATPVSTVIPSSSPAPSPVPTEIVTPVSDATPITSPKPVRTPIPLPTKKNYAKP